MTPGVELSRQSGEVRFTLGSTDIFPQASICASQKVSLVMGHGFSNLCRNESSAGKVEGLYFPQDSVGARASTEYPEGTG